MSVQGLQRASQGLNCGGTRSSYLIALAAMSAIALIHRYQSCQPLYFVSAEADVPHTGQTSVTGSGFCLAMSSVPPVPSEPHRER